MPQIPFPPPSVLGSSGNATYIIQVGHYFVMAQMSDGEILSLPIFYGTIQQANAYFYARLNNDVWFDAPLPDRLKALVQATDIIDSLNYAGMKVDANQIHEFPRKTEVGLLFFSTISGFPINLPQQIDSFVPVQVNIAGYEIAYKLLDGYDPDVAYENIPAESQGFASARTTYNRSFAPEYILAGIPSLKAWKLLKPFLRSPQNINVSRVS